LEFPHWELACEHLVEHDSQRVDIGAVINGMGRLQLFGRHILWRPHHLFGGGEREAFQIHAKKLGQAEVRDFHTPLFVHQDVLGLDVPVDDAFVVAEIGRRPL
jgi:hypothetical protein